MAAVGVQKMRSLVEKHQDEEVAGCSSAEVLAA